MLIFKKTFLPVLMLLPLMMLMGNASTAQCTSTVAAYPYDEGFENSNGGWAPNSNIHWAWGSLSGKAVIPGAGSGLKCWIAGGLSGSSYNDGSSELLSPCFNFSSLINPQLSLKVFWETELQFDGVTFQYSTNNGSSWSTLGSGNSNDACSGTSNWFNYPSVNYLGGEPGWSGNIQTGSSGQCLTGQGSGQWLTATHSLALLRGEPNVRFKFVFGAGTRCNGYDGFAFDDIHIAEGPAYNADFSFSCGSNNTAQFTSSTLPCQVGWNWNFGDPGSGANNTSTAQNPSHVYSAPGTFPVSLLVTYASGATGVAPVKRISIPDVLITKTEIRCNGENNGSIRAQVNPAGAYTYSWNTTPAQVTPMISNLSAGINYTVTITSATTCSVTVPVILSQPDPIVVNPVISPAKCGNNNGSIKANPTGGTSPYTFTWSNGSTGNEINNLAVGNYSVDVSDVNGCTAAPVTNIEVLAATNTVTPVLGNDTTICPGQTLILNPGTFAGYLWQDNATTPTYRVTQTGTYAVNVKDADGCSGSASVHITVDCRGVYFPSSFTPNTDLLNASFSPLGDIASLRNFNMIIYNRYSQIVFTSSDPFKGWDGTFKGKPSETGAYVWIAGYNLGSQNKTVKKGSVLLLR